MKPQTDPKVDYAFKHVFGREQNKPVLMSLFPDLADHHLIFELRDRHHGAFFTDHLAVHILELPKFNKSLGDLATPLDRWYFF